MKLREGFISNSSSASFILMKKYMTAPQIKKVMKYKDIDIIHHQEKHSSSESWHITEDEDVIKGFTLMDNGLLHSIIDTMKMHEKAILEWNHDG